MVTVLSYKGISGAEITTWAKLFDLVKDTLSNPYCLVLIIVSVYNAVIDPTTKGLKDSDRALNYDEPQ